MTDGKNLKETIVEEKAKIKVLTPKDRWSYFCSYYLKPVVIIIIIAAFLIYFFVNIFLGGTNDGYEGAIVNLSSTDVTENRLTEELETTILEGSKKAYLETDMNITFDIEETDQYAYANRLKLMSMVSAGELDYMILNQEAYDNLSKEAMFKELNDEDTVFEVVDGKAICLTKEEALRVLDITTDYNVYICFLVNGEHEDKNPMFVNYLEELGE